MTRPSRRSPSRRRVTEPTGVIALDPEPLLWRPDPLEPDLASHRFRILRPTDMVVLEVVGYGLELRIDEEGVALVRSAI